jgi:acetoin utilization deacetylase AcuC-like enzyme
MTALHAWSSARYTIPLPAGHRFPIEKYALLRERVIADGLIAPENLHEPERARIEDLLLVHTPGYVQSIIDGSLSPAAQRVLGLPWSPQLAERSFRAVGGTCEAAARALEDGIAVNLAGGTHHAFPDRGEGYCVFNDVAVAIRLLQRRGRIVRAAIVDLDVHQGNGTHAIFERDSSVFTLSLHGQRNYPFHKVPGSLDIELSDGTGDGEYLSQLRHALSKLDDFGPVDIVMYLAGADPLRGDRLGRLALTHAGLLARDEMVLRWCLERKTPLAVTIAGGYGADILDTVEVHVNTVRAAQRLLPHRDARAG